MPETQTTSDVALDQSDVSQEQRRHKMQKVVRRESVVEQFEADKTPIPDAPIGGALVKVHYAGACYTETQMLKAGKRRPKIHGIQDTSLYPGYEISGVVDSLCNTGERKDIKVGDRVIVYPEGDDDLEELQDGYVEYLKVRDVNNLVKVPQHLSLQVAAMLPSGALTAYCAVTRLIPFVEHKINQKKEKGPVNILVVGAGALGLWTIRLVRCIYSDKNINIACADTNIEKLMIAKEHGCFDVIHWNDSLHEEYLIERTQNVCRGGVDIIIDFSSSPRTINRAMKVLGQYGVIVVGGNSKYDVSFCLHSLALKQQCILGVSKGTRDQLEELVQLVADNKVKPPTYSIFPVDDANKVFEQLNQCKINGRAVLEICPIDSDDLA